MKLRQCLNRSFKIFIILTILLATSCFIISFLFIILPDIERGFCYSKVGRNLGTAPNYQEIIEYI
jgi:hypothetical protein